MLVLRTAFSWARLSRCEVERADGQQLSGLLLQLFMMCLCEHSLRTPVPYL